LGKKRSLVNICFSPYYTHFLVKKEISIFGLVLAYFKAFLKKIFAYYETALKITICLQLHLTVHSAVAHYSFRSLEFSV
jgi:hypothetical protein